MKKHESFGEFTSFDRSQTPEFFNDKQQLETDNSKKLNEIFDKQINLSIIERQSPILNSFDEIFKVEDHGDALNNSKNGKKTTNV